MNRLFHRYQIYKNNITLNRNILQAIYNQLGMFFNWISRCWGGMGVSTKFEKARVNCSIPDWTAPYQNDILVIIESFKGQNPQIASKMALNMFLSHLQHDEQRSHPAFLLKYLYVLDHATQELVGLDTIGYYYNSELLSSKKASSVQGTIKDIVLVSSSPIKELISGYYTYIKQKAKMYSQNQLTLCLNARLKQNSKKFAAMEQQNKSQTELKKIQLIQNFSKNTKRSDIFKKCPNREIFKTIQKCISMQKLIQDISDKYKNGNKSVELIKCIFTMLLKMYIYCYSIVSIGIKTLLGRFEQMDASDLQQFLKKIRFYNKEYTNSFISFVQTNKQIQIFKSIKYTQFTLISRQSIQIIKSFVEQKKEQQIQKGTELKQGQFAPKSKTLSLIPMQQQSYGKQLDLPSQLHQLLKIELKIQYKPRKPTLNFENLALNNEQNQEEKATAFLQYLNSYSQDFLIDNQLSSSIKSKGGNSSSMSSSKSPQKSMDFIKQKLSQSYSPENNLLNGQKMKQQINSKVSKSSIMFSNTPKYNMQKNDFAPQKWKNWQNVYSEPY